MPFTGYRPIILGNTLSIRIANGITGNHIAQVFMVKINSLVYYSNNDSISACNIPCRFHIYVNTCCSSGLPCVFQIILKGI